MEISKKSACSGSHRTGSRCNSFRMTVLDRSASPSRERVIRTFSPAPVPRSFSISTGLTVTAIGPELPPYTTAGISRCCRSRLATPLPNRVRTCPFSTASAIAPSFSRASHEAQVEPPPRTYTSDLLSSLSDEKAANGFLFVDAANSLPQKGRHGENGQFFRHSTIGKRDGIRDNHLFEG